MRDELDVVKGILQLLDELRQTHKEVRCTIIYSNDELTKILKKQFGNDKNISLCYAIDSSEIMPVDRTKVYIISKEDRFHRYIIY